MPRKDRPHTPDGRYLVSRGVLKRCTNPALDDGTRRRAVKALMQARMAKDREAVTAAKTALGETGPVWWSDGAADYSDQPPDQTPYVDWWHSLSDTERSAGD
jgi:hypothetical protein